MLYGQKMCMRPIEWKHFINVGRNLAHQLPPILTDPTKFIKRSFTNSFMFRGICTQEVHDLINVLEIS